ncbi:MAG: sigma-70 family RNA polymerase sigma factor [Firmicutes bacterium]|nr:sigma-70 family RNA polymerase sigma factor [Bacillota bacterium]
MKSQYQSADSYAIKTVTPEVAEQLAIFKRQDDNAARKTRWRKEASLDGIKERTGWEPADKSVDIGADYEKREEKETLITAVTKLNDEERRLVRLRYYEQKTLCEVGQILGISHQAVGKQLSKIHTTLKKYF